MGRPVYESFTLGFADYVRQNIDLRALQSWGVEALKQNPGTSGTISLKSDQLPSFVKNVWPLKSTSYSIETRADTGHRCVQILSGGGFHHWGVLVGAPNLQIESVRNFYCIILSPGVYVFSD